MQWRPDDGDSVRYWKTDRESPPPPQHVLRHLVSEDDAITYANTFLFMAGTVIVLAGLRAAMHFAIRVSLAAPRICETATPTTLGLSFETVYIPTANAKSLHAWLIPAAIPGPAPAVVAVHGWGGNAQMMLPLAGPLHRAGFALLLVDARCHGLSDGDSFASLPRFAEDVGHARDWVARRDDIDARRIALLGHSVGAGAVLLAAARRDDVAAVISISAFAHPADMMRRWLATRRIPNALGRYVLGYVEGVIGHRFDDIAPIHSITRVQCPVLLVHGQQDNIVPPSDARRIHAAGNAGLVELLELPGGHDSFDELDRELTAVVSFLLRTVARDR